MASSAKPKAIKVPGAKAPKLTPKLPSVPKAPQVNPNLKAFMPKFPKPGTTL